MVVNTGTVRMSVPIAPAQTMKQVTCVYIYIYHCFIVDSLH